MYFGKISMKTVNIKEGSYRKWQVLIFPEFSLIQKYSLPSFWIIKVCLRRKDWGWGRGRNSCSELNKQHVTDSAGVKRDSGSAHGSEMMMHRMAECGDSGSAIKDPRRESREAALTNEVPVA